MSGCEPLQNGIWPNINFSASDQGMYLIISKRMRLKTSCTIVEVIFPCPNEFFIEPESEDFAERTRISSHEDTLKNKSLSTYDALFSMRSLANPDLVLMRFFWPFTDPILYLIWELHVKLEIYNLLFLAVIFLTSASPGSFFSNIWVFGSNEFLCSPRLPHCSTKNLLLFWRIYIRNK